MANKLMKTGIQMAEGTTIKAPKGTEMYSILKIGTFTTAGGDASESITVTDMVSTDTALVWVQKAGATPRTVNSWTSGTGAIAVTLSGDPSTDHVLGYIVVRQEF